MKKRKYSMLVVSLAAVITAIVLPETAASMLITTLAGTLAVLLSDRLRG